MHGSPFEIVAAIVGFAFLALGVAAIGQWLRDGLDMLFGRQMQEQFPEDPSK